MREGCVVIVPVKAPGRGKSRLVGVSELDRGRLATAFAGDTVAACLAAESVVEVLVVTDDPVLADLAATWGANPHSDGGDGLNAALRAAAGASRVRRPHHRPVAVLADLPAVRAGEIDEVLTRLPEGPAYVVDADGTGTTLYTAGYADFDPRFGADSAAAHRAAGAVAIGGGLAGLRRDVDDLDALRAAEALGVGPATSSVLRDVAGPR